MSALRFPFDEILAAISARLLADKPALKIWALVPQATPKPYVEMAGISLNDRSFKGTGAIEIFTVFSCISADSSAKDINAILNDVVGSLTRSPFPVLTGDWVIEDVDQDGPVEVHKEFDSVEVFWRGSLRVAWLVRDQRAR